MDMIAKTLLHKLLLKVAKNYKVFSVKKKCNDSILNFFTLRRKVKDSEVTHFYQELKILCESKPPLTTTFLTCN